MGRNGCAILELARQTGRYYPLKATRMKALPAASDLQIDALKSIVVFQISRDDLLGETIKPQNACLDRTLDSVWIADL